MKRLKIISFILLTMVIGSCSDVLDKNINKATIENDIEKIKVINPKIDKFKLEILETILAFSKGRESYIEFIKSEDYIVDEVKFNEAIDSLFNYFGANNITYDDLIKELDLIQVINEKHSDKPQITNDSLIIMHNINTITDKIFTFSEEIEKE